jgi:hypothetical protein
MPYNALQFLTGIGRGIRSGRDRQHQYDREEFMNDMQRQQLDLERAGQKQRGDLGNRELELRGMGLEQEGEAQDAANAARMREEEYRNRVFSSSQEDITGGHGFNIDLGGQHYNLPGRLATLEALMPGYREQIDQQGATARNAADIQARVAHPEVYGGSGRTPMTPAEARMKLITDIWGPASLGEAPGSTRSKYDEALRASQESMPELFGHPVPTATEHTLDTLQKDPRAQTREGAKAMLEDMRKTEPGLFRELDLDKISDYIGNLPRGTTSTRKIPPDEMRMNMSRPSFIK